MREDSIKKADRELTKVAQKAMDDIYYGTCLALHRHYRWGKQRISKFMDISQQVFSEVAQDQDRSMVQVCDEEVHIEFRSTKNESYKECPYLCTAKWNAMQEEWHSKPQSYQIAWLVRMKQKMQDWMYPQIMASVTLAMHRKEGWGMQRIQKLVVEIEDIIWEFNQNSKALCEAVRIETGLSYVHTNSGELALLKESE